MWSCTNNCRFFIDRQPRSGARAQPTFIRDGSLIPADASLPESAAMDANTLELLDCYGARLMKELRWSEPTKMWPYCWTPYC